MMEKKLYMSVINDLVGDQRVHRIASSLQEMGYEVTVIGRKLPHSQAIQDRPYRTHRMRLWFTKGKLFYLEYNLRLFLYLLSRRSIHCLNANDLDTLLANFGVHRVRGCKLVYDSHELFTEVPELINRPRSRKIWLRLEQWLFPKLTQVYTVNASLARIYSQTYQTPVHIIRNLPLSKTHPPTNQRKKILLYQGALNVGRGIDLMIRSLQHLPDFQLWIAGKGDVEDELKTLVKTEALSERVVFHGLVPFEQLYKLTEQALIGFSLEEDLGGNYHYASPNKVYDYIQSHVPVIVSDLPEMRITVETYRVGKVMRFAERSPKKLAEMIRSMTEDAAIYQTYQSACEVAAKELCWEKEKGKLKELYK